MSCGSCVTAKFSELDRSLPPLLHCPLCNMASQLELIIDNQFLIEQHTNDESQNNTETDTKVSFFNKFIYLFNINIMLIPKLYIGFNKMQ